MIYCCCWSRGTRVTLAALHVPFSLQCNAWSVWVAEVQACLPCAMWSDNAMHKAMNISQRWENSNHNLPLRWASKRVRSALKTSWENSPTAQWQKEVSVQNREYQLPLGCSCHCKNELKVCNLLCSRTGGSLQSSFGNTLLLFCICLVFLGELEHRVTVGVFLLQPWHTTYPLKWRFVCSQNTLECQETTVNKKGGKPSVFH